MNEARLSRTSRNLLWSLLAAIVVMVIGTLGYRWLGGPQYSWLDCFYMTFITVTTIGYVESVDVTQYEYGKLFTIFIGLTGIGVLGYVLSTVTAFMLEGEFNLLFGVSPDYFEKMSASPSINLIKVNALNTMFLGMQLDRPPLADRRVREAIVRGVDRQRLAALLGRGAMIPAKGPLPPGCDGFDPAVSQPSYDPGRARTLLAESGVGGALTLRLLYFNASELWSEIVRALQDHLKKVGIAVQEVKVASWKDFHEARKKGSHDLYLYKWVVSTPDPARFLVGLFQSDSPNNFGRFSHAGVDIRLREARGHMEESRRLGLHREVARLVAEELPSLSLFHQINLAAASTRVKGLALNSYGLPQDKLATVELR